MSIDFTIDVRGLTKRFGARTVVDDLSIQVRRGEICGFLGPNGSGKTTTIRMLCGLLEPDAGEGTCLGHDIRRESRQIKLRVGYMTQRFGLYDDLSIEENLDFVARALRHAGPARRRRRQRSSALGCLHAAPSSPARCRAAGSNAWRWPPACCTSPTCCCSTNPPPASTPRRGATSGQQIHALAAEGLTVLVSTHYMDEAERCHRLAYIAYGKLLAAGTAAEVVAQANLATWDLTGDDLARASALLQQDPRWMVVAFGTTLHVSAVRGGADLPAWLAAQAPGARWTVSAIDTGLEDVFISLTQHATDNFQ